MGQSLSPKQLSYFSYLSGILTAGGMGLLYIAGEDDKGLFPSMHIGWILACLVAVAGMLQVGYLSRNLGGKFRYRQLFAPSAPAAAGTLAAGVGFAVDGVANIFGHGDIYGITCGFLCLVSAFALLFLARCRFTGQRPVFFVRAVVTVSLMLRLICCFRHWTDPQLQTYLFPLLSSVFLMLACYHRTTLDAGSGSRKAYVFTSQAAVILSCGAVFSDSWLFYLTAALWMGLDMPDLRTIKKLSSKD